jgi:hypothetical protein
MTGAAHAVRRRIGKPVAHRTVRVGRLRTSVTSSTTPGTTAAAETSSHSCAGRRQGTVTSAMKVPKNEKTAPTANRFSDAACVFAAKRKPQPVQRGRTALRKPARSGAATKGPGSGGGDTARASPSARTQQAQSVAHGPRQEAAPRSCFTQNRHDSIGTGRFRTRRPAASRAKSPNREPGGIAIARRAARYRDAAPSHGARRRFPRKTLLRRFNNELPSEENDGAKHSPV